MPPASSKPVGQTLLLSPPSLSSRPETLESIIYSQYDSSTTDLQMLDRLAFGLVSLPPSKYDRVLFLADADGSYREVHALAERGVLRKIAESLKPGGRLCSQNGTNGLQGDIYRTEAILAGLVGDESGGFVKPDFGDQHSVPLRVGAKKPKKMAIENGQAVIQQLKTASQAARESNRYKGTGQTHASSFIDFADDFVVAVADNTGTGRPDSGLIDENGILDESDMGQPIIQPPECRPKAGKRRRACKDCTCGLAQKLEEEDAIRRTNADRELNSMKLKRNDLAEVDFTVQGKVGSCGNCALGDAFRCDGCPYIGLPAFKPGEEVRLLTNDVQL